MKRLCVTFLLLLVFLCGCDEIVESKSDELTMYSYKEEYENGCMITLSFDSDKALLIFKTAEEEFTISGFCEVSNEIFVIHDEKTKTPYAFEYELYFDKIDIMHGKNTVSLSKIIQ